MKLKEIVLAGALGVVSCGDEVHNYYGTETNSPSQGSSLCGNSRWAGKYMQELGCKLNWHMREDCRVGGIRRSGEYIYQWEDNNTQEWATYHGNELRFSDGKSVVFNPNLRFTPEAGSDQEKIALLNRILDENGGAILINGESQSENNLDDNAYIPMNEPGKSREECKLSWFYVRY